jgi:hypothetical protein
MAIRIDGFIAEKVQKFCRNDADTLILLARQTYLDGMIRFAIMLLPGMLVQRLKFSLGHLPT